MLDLGPEITEFGDVLDLTFIHVLDSGRFILDTTVEAVEHEGGGYLGAYKDGGLDTSIDDGVTRADAANE